MSRFIRKIPVILLIVLFLAPSSGLAIPSNTNNSKEQTDYAGKLETYLKTQMERYKIPGLAIAIVRNGEIEYMNGFGKANDRNDAVTPDTPFLLNSLSKSFTAIGIMQLAEEGKIDISDPVQKYIPWFKVASGQGREITIANLLYQTSGLSKISGNKVLLKRDTSNALEDGVRDLIREKLDFNPGDNWEYSNLNYNVLGYLIQVISGQDYGDYINDHIFSPLDMKHSYTSMPTAMENGAARGYYPFFGIPVDYNRYIPFTRRSLPSGGLWSSASDMTHYLIAHLNSGQFGTASILSADSVMKLHLAGFMTNDTQGYAMGWVVYRGFLAPEYLKTLKTDLNNYGTLTTLYHSGTSADYHSSILLLPDLNYGVVILENTNNQTNASAFDYFPWDVTLIATGGEAQYYLPAESFLLRNSLWILGGTTLLLALGLIGSSRLLVKAIKGAKIRMPRILIAVVIPIILSLMIIGIIFFYLLPQNTSTLPITIKGAPDIGILLLLIVLLSIIWSLSSAILLGLMWTKSRAIG